MCDCIRISIMAIGSAITCSVWSPLPPISVENATFIPQLLIFSPVSLCSSSGLRNAVITTFWNKLFFWKDQAASIQARLISPAGLQFPARYLIWGGSTLSRWRCACWCSGTGRDTQLTQLPLTRRALHAQTLLLVCSLQANMWHSIFDWESQHPLIPRQEVVPKV